MSKDIKFNASLKKVQNKRLASSADFDQKGNKTSTDKKISN